MKPRVTRIEVIDHRTNSEEQGRVFVIWAASPFKIELSPQDEGRTLKIFLSDE